MDKVDRSGADVEDVLDQVRRRLTPSVVPLTQVEGAGARDARVTAVPLTRDEVVIALAEGDDRVLDDWASDRPVSSAAARAALRRGLLAGALTPVLCGSAVTGAGLPLLCDALTTLLPRPSPPPGDRAATVFAVDRDERGRRAWVRVWSGELRVRDRLAFGAAEPARVTEVAVSTPEGLRPGAAGAGQIAVVRGPTARIGDTVGRPPSRRVHRFTPASLQALVEPIDPTRRTAMYAGLVELADEDPLIDLRLDEVDGEAAVSLHGEVQKEVLAALLEERYGVAVRFFDTSTVCLERVVGAGASTDRIGTGGNPYLAGLGLRIQAASVGHGVEFSPGVERGNLPPARPRPPRPSGLVARCPEVTAGGSRTADHWDHRQCWIVPRQVPGDPALLSADRLRRTPSNGPTVSAPITTEAPILAGERATLPARCVEKGVEKERQ